MSPKANPVWFIGTAVIAAMAIGAAYFPGLNSTFHFDDHLNLAGLADIDNVHGALTFVLSGDAGPTGRPISLASFLPHTGAELEDAQPMIATNIFIHFLNGVLVALLASILGRQALSTSHPQRIPWIALASAAIWLALPLLASSSLFVIQRMTLLSTFFVLTGLLLHFHGKALLDVRPKTGVALMTAGIFVGLTLGMLAKENAAIYPFLVLLLDHTVARPRNHPESKTYRVWRAFFIAAPAILVATYLVYRLSSGGGYEHRHFDLEERVLTQGIVLFEYLKLLILPNTLEIGPFHDHYPIFGGYAKSVAILASLFWIVIAITAILKARTFPIFSFVVLWFISGHLLESTWIPLELYYEHRNYLPAVGLIIGLAIAIGKLPTRYFRYGATGSALYTTLLSITLFQVTSLWGNPRVAAEVWWDRNPESLRAAQFLSNYHVQEGFPLIAARILDRTSDLDGRQLVLQIQSARLKCEATQDDAAKRQIERIHAEAPTTIFANRQPDNDANALNALVNSIESGRCRAIEPEKVHKTAQAYLQNPAIESRHRTRYNFLVVSSRAAGLGRQDEIMLESLTQAIEARASLPTARIAAQMASERDDRERFERIRRSVIDNRPQWHPTRLREWREAMEAIEGHRAALSSSDNTRR